MRSSRYSSGVPSHLQTARARLNGRERSFNWIVKNRVVVRCCNTTLTCVCGRYIRALKRKPNSSGFVNAAPDSTRPGTRYFCWYPRPSCEYVKINTSIYFNGLPFVQYKGMLRGFKMTKSWSYIRFFAHHGNISP